MKKFSIFYIALILVFLFAPIAVLIFFSFNEGSSTSVFTGFSFKWYTELFKNSEILNALKNSLILAVASSAIATVIGTAAAFGIHHMKNKWLKNFVLSATCFFPGDRKKTFGTFKPTPEAVLSFLRSRLFYIPLVSFLSIQP